MGDTVVGLRAPVGIGVRVPELRGPDLENWTAAAYGANADQLIRVKAAFRSRWPLSTLPMWLRKAPSTASRGEPHLSRLLRRSITSRGEEAVDGWG